MAGDPTIPSGGAPASGAGMAASDADERQTMPMAAPSGMDAPTSSSSDGSDEDSYELVAPVPMFRVHVNLDHTTQQSLERLRDKVLKDHAASDDPHPNHVDKRAMKWLMDLIYRDAPTLGAEAIVTGGLLVFARFQSDKTVQKKVEADLKAVAIQAQLTMQVEQPLMTQWWHDVWVRALQASPVDPRVLAGIIREVGAGSPRPEDEKLRTEWLNQIGELSNSDFKLAVDTLADEETETLLPRPTDDAFVVKVDAFKKLGQEQNLSLINRQIATLFMEAGTAPTVLEAACRMKYLKDAVDGLELDGVKVKPQRDVSETPEVPKPNLGDKIADQIRELALQLEANLHPEMNAARQQIQRQSGSILVELMLTQADLRKLVPLMMKTMQLGSVWQNLGDDAKANSLFDSVAYLLEHTEAAALSRQDLQEKLSKVRAHFSREHLINIQPLSERLSTTLKEKGLESAIGLLEENKMATYATSELMTLSDRYYEQFVLPQQIKQFAEELKKERQDPIEFGRAVAFAAAITGHTLRLLGDEEGAKDLFDGAREIARGKYGNVGMLTVVNDKIRDPNPLSERWERETLTPLRQKLENSGAQLIWKKINESPRIQGEPFPDAKAEVLYFIAKHLQEKGRLGKLQAATSETTVPTVGAIHELPLQAPDLTTEQQFILEKMREINSYTNGAPWPDMLVMSVYTQFIRSLLKPHDPAQKMDPQGLATFLTPEHGVTPEAKAAFLRNIADAEKGILNLDEEDAKEFWRVKVWMRDGLNVLDLISQTPGDKLKLVLLAAYAAQLCGYKIIRLEGTPLPVGGIVNGGYRITRVDEERIMVGGGLPQVILEKGDVASDGGKNILNDLHFVAHPLQPVVVKEVGDQIHVTTSTSLKLQATPAGVPPKSRAELFWEYKDRILREVEDLARAISRDSSFPQEALLFELGRISLVLGDVDAGTNYLRQAKILFERNGIGPVVAKNLEKIEALLRGITTPVGPNKIVELVTQGDVEPFFLPFETEIVEFGRFSLPARLQALTGLAMALRGFTVVDAVTIKLADQIPEKPLRGPFGAAHIDVTPVLSDAQNKILAYVERHAETNFNHFLRQDSITNTNIESICGLALAYRLLGEEQKAESLFQRIGSQLLPKAATPHAGTILVLYEASRVPFDILQSHTRLSQIPGLTSVLRNVLELAEQGRWDDALFALTSHKALLLVLAIANTYEVEHLGTVPLQPGDVVVPVGAQPTTFTRAQHAILFRLLKINDLSITEIKLTIQQSGMAQIHYGRGVVGGTHLGLGSRLQAGDLVIFRSVGTQDETLLSTDIKPYLKIKPVERVPASDVGAPKVPLLGAPAPNAAQGKILAAVQAAVPVVLKYVQNQNGNVGTLIIEQVAALAYCLEMFGKKEEADDLFNQAVRMVEHPQFGDRRAKGKQEALKIIERFKNKSVSILYKKEWTTLSKTPWLRTELQQVLEQAEAGQWDEALSSLDQVDTGERRWVWALLLAIANGFEVQPIEVKPINPEAGDVVIPVGKQFVATSPPPSSQWALLQKPMYDDLIALFNPHVQELLVHISPDGNITFKSGSQVKSRHMHDLGWHPNPMPFTEGDRIIFRRKTNNDFTVLNADYVEHYLHIKIKPAPSGVAMIPNVGATHASPLPGTQVPERVMYLEPQIYDLNSLPKRDPKTIGNGTTDYEKYKAYIPDYSKKKIIYFERFHRTLNEVATLVQSRKRIAIRLIGPPGGAKTTIPDLIAEKMGVPLFRVPFSKKLDADELLGYYSKQYEGGKWVTVWEYGAIPLAMKYGFHLVWDEADLARDGVIAALNEMINPNGFVWMKNEKGKIEPFSVHEAYRLYMTVNGRNRPGQDMLSRFVTVKVDPWDETELTEVITNKYEKDETGVSRWDHRITQALASLHLEMEKLASVGSQVEGVEVRLGDLLGQKIEFTPRHIQRIAQRLQALGEVTPENLSRALRAEYILPLASLADREVVWKVINAQFVTVARALGWTQSLGPQVIPTPTQESILAQYGVLLAETPDFAVTRQMLLLADETLWNRSLGIDVMYLGDTGEGKTSLPEALANAMKQKFYSMEMHSKIDSQDLVGKFETVGEETQLVPSMALQATEEGGFLYMNEYLLADPAKTEPIFNSLTDDEKAIISVRPFFKMKRNGKLFIVFASNFPWGQSAGGRYAQSGAAMSRLAVMCLTGEFASNEADRIQIAQHALKYASHVKVAAPGPLKKLVLPPASTPAPVAAAPAADDGKDSLSRGRSDVQAMAPSGTWKNLDASRYRRVTVHRELREKFKLPLHLIFDAGEQKLMAVSPEGTPAEMSAPLKRSLERFKAYLVEKTYEDMVPITGKKFSIKFSFKGTHRHNLTKRAITINEMDILRFSLRGALGILKHEYTHGFDKLHPFYFGLEPVQLFANAVLDTRVDSLSAALDGEPTGLSPTITDRSGTRHLHAGSEFTLQSVEQVKATWPEFPSHHQRKQFLQLFPYEQFVDAIVYHWAWGRLQPWMKDERVIVAFNEALPLLEQSARLFPKPKNEADIDAKADALYALMDRVMPIYQRMIATSAEDIRQKLASGDDPQDIMVLGFPPGARENVPAIPPELLQPENEDALIVFIIKWRSGGLVAQHASFVPVDLQDAMDEFQSGWNWNLIKDSPPPAPSLTDEDRREMAKVQATPRLNAPMIENLYAKYLPPGLGRVADDMERRGIVPQAEPDVLVGHYLRGHAEDPEAVALENASGVHEGRTWLQYGESQDREGNIIVLSDVSGSMDPAKENTYRASAAGIWLSERFKINYGEYMFGGNILAVKPFGPPTGDEAAKNRMIHIKQQAFVKDSAIQKAVNNRRTNLRAPLSMAIEKLRDAPGHAKFILLITDGRESNDVVFRKSFQQLIDQARSYGIQIKILAMGSEAQAAVPVYFKDENEKRGKVVSWEFVNPDGSDLKDRVRDLFVGCQTKRLGKEEIAVSRYMAGGVLVKGGAVLAAGPQTVVQPGVVQVAALQKPKIEGHWAGALQPFLERFFRARDTLSNQKWEGFEGHRMQLLGLMNELIQTHNVRALQTILQKYQELGLAAEEMRIWEAASLVLNGSRSLPPEITVPAGQEVQQQLMAAPVGTPVLAPQGIAPAATPIGVH